MVAFSALSPDFSSAAWTLTSAVANSTDPTRVEIDMTVQGAGARSTSGYDLTGGSFSWRHWLLPTGGPFDVDLMASNSAGSAIRLIANSARTTVSLYNGSTATLVGTVPFSDATDYPYWRLRNSGGTTYLETSASPSFATIANSLSFTSSIAITDLYPRFYQNQSNVGEQGIWKVQEVNGAATPTIVDPVTVSSYAGSVVSAGTWASTTNAIGSTSATYATNTGSTQNTEYPLDLGTFDFSSIPTGSTIQSVSVLVRAKASANSRSSIRAEAYDGTTLLSGSLALTALTTTDQNFTFTPTATVTQLKSANFKIRVIYKRTASQACTGSLDYVSVTVNYFAPGGAAIAATASASVVTALSGTITKTTATGVAASGSTALTTALSSTYLTEARAYQGPATTGVTTSLSGTITKTTSVALTQTIPSDFTQWTIDSTSGTTATTTTLTQPAGAGPTTLSGPYDLTGSYWSWQITQRTNNLTGVTSSIEARISGSSANMLRFLISGANVFPRYISGGVSTDTGTSFAYTEGQFYRFRESAGTVYWETSSDSQSWTQVGSALVSSMGLDLTAITPRIATTNTAPQASPGSLVVTNVNTTVTGTAIALAGASSLVTTVSGTASQRTSAVSATAAVTTALGGTSAQVAVGIAGSSAVTTALVGTNLLRSTLFSASMSMVTSLSSTTISRAEPLAAQADLVTFTSAGATEGRLLTGSTSLTTALGGTTPAVTVPLVGSTSLMTSLTGTLSRSTPISAASGVTTTVGGSAGLVIPASASSALSSALSGAVSENSPLAGAASLATSLSGSFSSATEKLEVGSAALTTSLTGSMSIDRPFSAAASLVTSLSGTVSKGIASTASTALTTTTTATASRASAVSASISLTTITTATPSEVRLLSGATSLVIDNTGASSTAETVVASSALTTNLVGTISLGGETSASTGLTTSLVGLMSIEHAAEATASAVFAVDGTVTSELSISGSTDLITSLTADVTNVVPISGATSLITTFDGVSSFESTALGAASLVTSLSGTMTVASEVAGSTSLRITSANQNRLRRDRVLDADVVSLATDATAEITKGKFVAGSVSLTTSVSNAPTIRQITLSGTTGLRVGFTAVDTSEASPVVASTGTTTNATGTLSLRKSISGSTAITTVVDGLAFVRDFNVVGTSELATVAATAVLDRNAFMAGEIDLVTSLIGFFGNLDVRPIPVVVTTGHGGVSVVGDNNGVTVSVRPRSPQGLRGTREVTVSVAPREPR